VNGTVQTFSSFEWLTEFDDSAYQAGELVGTVINLRHSSFAQMLKAGMVLLALTKKKKKKSLI